MEAQQAAQEFTEGASAAMYDPELIATLRQAFVLPTIEVEKPSFVFETGACFVAGTLVHTKGGLIPIEKLKIGDLVLSKPESGEGELAYKRVVRTFVHDDRVVIEIQYRIDRETDPLKMVFDLLTSTPDHPFWVKGQGWTAASDLLDQRLDDPHFQLASGFEPSIEALKEICSTDQPGIGWVLEHRTAKHTLGATGTLWDFKNARHIADDVRYDFDKWHSPDTQKDAFAPFKTTVYNIEVEDYHTYFVGEHGVWVHNADCDGVKLFSGGVGFTQGDAAVGFSGDGAAEGPSQHASVELRIQRCG